MAANSKIGWTDHTQNFWIGCTETSPACDYCYARELSQRYGWATWGAGEPRHRTSEANRKKPFAWNRAAAKLGVRYRVFAQSLSDWSDVEVPEEWRGDMEATVDATLDLDWLLLSKRHSPVLKWCRDRAPKPNVRIGFTVENQEWADVRLVLLSQIKQMGWKTFVSYEPALGPVDWSPHMGAIDWLIAGGESGTNARPMHPQWARQARAACLDAGVPFFFKQWGAWEPHSPQAGGDLGGDVRSGRVRIVHPTGQSDVEVAKATGGRNTIPGSRYMRRVTKKIELPALDGRQWLEFPAPTEPTGG